MVITIYLDDKQNEFAKTRQKLLKRLQNSEILDISWLKTCSDVFLLPFKNSERKES